MSEGGGLEWKAGCVQMNFIHDLRPCRHVPCIWTMLLMAVFLLDLPTVYVIWRQCMLLYQVMIPTLPLGFKGNTSTVTLQGQLPCDMGYGKLACLLQYRLGLGLILCFFFPLQFYGTYSPSPSTNKPLKIENQKLPLETTGTKKSTRKEGSESCYFLGWGWTKIVRQSEMEQELLLNIKTLYYSIQF